MQSDAIRHKDLQSWIPRQARYDICESPDYDRVLTLPQARQSVVVIALTATCSSAEKRNPEKQPGVPVAADLQSWIPRQARYDDLTPRGGDAKRQECLSRTTARNESRQSVVVIPQKCGIQKTTRNESRQSVAVIPQKCGIQKKASYPADVPWIPRKARYDDLTLRGGDA